MFLPKKKITTHPKKPASKHLWHSQKGFTLVEVMVALVVMAIIAAFAVPALLDWNRNRGVLKDARYVYTNLQLAKIVAIRENCNVVANINGGGYELFLDNGGSSNGFAGDNVRNGGEKLVATARFGINTEISGIITTGFTSRGLALNTGSIVFTRIDRKKENVLRHQNVWYRVRLSPAGHLAFEVSNDSTKWYAK